MVKLYNLAAGSRIPEDIIEIAVREKIRTAKVEGIGAVSSLKLAYLNQRAKRYEQHDYDEYLEVASLLGNITTKDGKPFLHVHGTFGRRDMSALAGHVMSATVSPALEVVVIPTTNWALRRFDEEVGMNVIYRA